MTKAELIKMLPKKKQGIKWHTKRNPPVSRADLYTTQISFYALLAYNQAIDACIEALEGKVMLKERLYWCSCCGGAKPAEAIVKEQNKKIRS